MERASSLLQCYLTTDYEVHGRSARERFTLRIGQREPKLAAMLARTGVQSAAFITAWHPRSVERSRKQNEVAQARLRADLLRLRCVVLPAEGVGANGAWREPSWLALGLYPADAKRLARRYRQNAILVCDKRGVPRLVTLQELT